MKKETLRFITLGCLLFVASVLQFLGVSLFGVVPNFVLAVIVVAALFLGDMIHELFLVALASFLLKFSPTAERELFAFFAVGFLVCVAVRRLPWHVFINGMFLTVCSVGALYALIDPAQLLSFMFAQELVYTIALVSAIYYGLTSLRLFRTIR